jgi:FKBP-type peptidyl-prolyl cis-trans isomerase FkpA
MLVCLALLVPGVACQRDNAPVTPRTEEQKLLYALGVHMGRGQAVLQLTSAELEYVFQGMREQALREQRAMELEISDELAELARRRMEQQAAREKEKARPFLEQVAREPGVVKTESGLLFRSLAEGTGPSPSATDRVKVHFRGLRMDGGEFENTYQKDKPFEFQVGRVLPCLTEAVQRMKPGGKARLVCPSELAFGDAGLGEAVAGGAPVVFELELLESGVRPPNEGG